MASTPGSASLVYLDDADVFDVSVLRSMCLPVRTQAHKGSGYVGAASSIILEDAISDQHAVRNNAADIRASRGP